MGGEVKGNLVYLLAEYRQVAKEAKALGDQCIDVGRRAHTLAEDIKAAIQAVNEAKLNG